MHVNDPLQPLHVHTLSYLLQTGDDVYEKQGRDAVKTGLVFVEPRANQWRREAKPQRKTTRK